jgi:hypothetical protein
METGLRVKIPQQGKKHAVIVASGYLDGDAAITLFSIMDLTPQPTSLYLTEAIWGLQGKLGVNLFWGMRGSKEEELLLPMESRGRFDFSAFRGLASPKDWDGNVILRSFGCEKRSHLLFILHMEKADG